MALADSLTGACGGGGGVVLIEHHPSEEEEDGEVLEEEEEHLSTNDSCAEVQPFLHGPVFSTLQSPVPAAPPPPGLNFSSFQVSHHISTISASGASGISSNNLKIPPPPPTPPPASLCNVTNVGRPRPTLIFHSGNTLLPPPPPPPPLEVEEGEAAEENASLMGPDTFGRGLLGSNPTLISAITQTHHTSSLPSNSSAVNQVHKPGIVDIDHYRHPFAQKAAVLQPRPVQPAISVAYHHHPKPPPLAAINGVSLHTHASAHDRNPQYTSVVHKRLKQSGQGFPAYDHELSTPSLGAIPPRLLEHTKSAIATAIAQCSNGEGLNRKLNGGDGGGPKRLQTSQKSGTRIPRQSSHQLSHQPSFARDVTARNELERPVQVAAVNNVDRGQPEVPKVRKVEDDSSSLTVERIPKKARSINGLALSVPVSEDERSERSFFPQPRLKMRTKAIGGFESSRDSYQESAKQDKSSSIMCGVVIDDVLLPDLESPAKPVTEVQKKRSLHSGGPSFSHESKANYATVSNDTNTAGSELLLTRGMTMREESTTKISGVVPKHSSHHPKLRPRDRTKCTGKNISNIDAVCFEPSSQKKELKRRVEGVQSGEKPDHSPKQLITESSCKPRSPILTPTPPLLSRVEVDTAETTASAPSQERAAEQVPSAKTDDAGTSEGMSSLQLPRSKGSQQAPRKRKRLRSASDKLRGELFKSSDPLSSELTNSRCSALTNETEDLTNFSATIIELTVSDEEQRGQTPLVESPTSIESSAETVQCLQSRPGSPLTGEVPPPRLVWPVTGGTLVLNWRQGCHQEGTESCSTTTARSLDESRSELGATSCSSEGRFASAPFVVSAKPLEWALGLAVKKRAISSEHLFSFGQKLSEKLTSCEKNTDNAISSSIGKADASTSPPATPSPQSSRATTFAAGQQVLMTAAAAVRDDFSRRRCVSWISPTCMITGEGGLGLAEWIEQSAPYSGGVGEEEGSEDEAWGPTLGSMFRKRKQILSDLLINHPPPHSAAVDVEEDEDDNNNDVDDDIVSHSSFAGLSSDEEPPVQIPCFIDVDEEQDRNSVTSALLDCFDSSFDDNYKASFYNCPRTQREKERSSR